MATEEEVKMFLTEFKGKLLISDVIFEDRPKNLQSILDLGIKPGERTTFLKELKVIDFSQGPIPDNMDYHSDLWVFGVEINSEEVYIKITLGKAGLNSICISFHIAEFEMNYPFKS